MLSLHNNAYCYCLLHITRYLNVEDERIRQEWFNATSNLADTLRSQLVMVENNELYYT